MSQIFGGSSGGGGSSSPLTTKGDLWCFTTVDARLAAGTNGQILSADSTQSTGLKWIDANYANLTLGNVAGTTALGVDLLPASNAGASIGSSSKGWLNGWFTGTVGVGGLGFGAATAELVASGANSHPTLYLYPGSGSACGIYGVTSSFLFNIGGTDVCAIDGSGYALLSGFGRFGVSGLANYKLLQVYGAFAVPSRQTVSSNADFTISNGVSKLKIKWAAAPAARTVTFPALMDDGQEITISCDSGSSCAAVTYLGNGHTIDGGLPAAWSASKGFTVWYDSTDNTIYRKDGQ